MFLVNLKNFILLTLICFMITCYKAPVFELTVQIKNQDLDPVENVSVKIVISDIDSGEILENTDLSDINGEELNCKTNSAGECFFSFDNKAFVTILACSVSEEDAVMCQQGYVYIEEDENNIGILMLETPENDDYNCNYCNF